MYWSSGRDRPFPVHALTGQLFGTALSRTGLASAILIAVGILIPVDVPGADLADFVGYLLWSAWLIALAVTLLGTRRPVVDVLSPAEVCCG